MSITPWQTRWDTLGIPKDTAIQGEIDELRAALQERAAAKPPAVLMNQLVNDKLELSAKLAERDAEIERRKGTLQDVRGHYERVCKERDALKADAERYRWLREQDDTSPLFCMYGSNGPWGECGHSDIYGDLLDTSIDKELKGTS